MHWGWIVLLIGGTLLLLLCIAPIQIEIRYSRRAKQDELQIRFRALFGLVRYSIYLPEIELIVARSRKLKIKADTLTGGGNQFKRERPDVKLSVEYISRLISSSFKMTEKLHRFLPNLRSLTKVLHVIQFRWHTHFGLADAAVTGTTAGALWMVKGSVLGLVSRYLSFQEVPDVAVTPRFHGNSLDTELHCIIRFWPGQAIVAAVKMGIYLLREGKTPWQIIRYRV